MTMAKTKTPTQTGQRLQPQTTELALSARTRIPRRVWVVVRYDLRGHERPKIIARFATPTYAVIFRNALIALNPTAEDMFRIKEKLL